MDLSMTATEDQARLLRVPGVANVPIWGERLECFRCRWIPSASENSTSSSKTL